MRSRSTGRPPTRCSATIAAASSGRTLPYQTASGYTTTVGPCSHWSRQPDLLMRTLPPSPAAFDQLLQLGVQIAFSVRGAGRPRRVLGADVVADKDVAFKCGQAAILLNPDHFQTNASRRARSPRRTSAKFPQFASCPPARICENKSLTMSTDNLLSLKDDMVAFIEGHGLRRLPGYVTEDIPSIVWEGQDNPDAWKDFVEMAKHVGAPFVTFSEMTLEREELDALIEEAGEMNFPDEEATELVEAQVAAQVRRHARLHPARLRLPGAGLSARNHHRVV